MNKNSLEQDLINLEEIINKMEDPATTFEDLIKLYEDGKSLLSKCDKKISIAENKITELNELQNEK